MANNINHNHKNIILLEKPKKALNKLKKSNAEEAKKIEAFFSKIESGSYGEIKDKQLNGELSNCREFGIGKFRALFKVKDGVTYITDLIQRKNLNKATNTPLNIKSIPKETPFVKIDKNNSQDIINFVTTDKPFDVDKYFENRGIKNIEQAINKLNIVFMGIYLKKESFTKNNYNNLLKYKEFPFEKGRLKNDLTNRLLVDTYDKKSNSINFVKLKADYIKEIENQKKSHKTNSKSHYANIK
jgi:mRNA-degrading endonuclease RelE of RelBE toxin-antitoxin system